MAGKKIVQCDVTDSHAPHDMWQDSALYPLDPEAEPHLVHCPGLNWGEAVDA